MTYVSIAAIIIGTAISAYSVIQQSNYQAQAAAMAGIAAQNQADYTRQLAAMSAQMAAADAGNAMEFAEMNAQINEQRAEFFDQQARYAQAAGDLQVQDTYQAGDRLQSTARASIAKAGVDMTGSPLDVLMENAAAIEEEAERLRYGTSLDVYAAKADATAARGGAAVARAQGRLDAASIQNQSVMRQFGFANTISGYEGESRMQRGNARNIRRATPFGVGSTILSGAGSLGTLRFGA